MEQLEPALRLVTRFGELSGLHAQPTKSKPIFLNASIRLEQFHGISVLPPNEAIRYLGYDVGAGEMVNRNRALHLRRVQRRLLTASKVTTSVQQRVLIFYAIIVPAVLFTAAVFDILDRARIELTKLYKRFMWQHASETEVSRHKINPGLLVTTKQAGGVGLASFDVVIKIQRMKHALNGSRRYRTSTF